MLENMIARLRKNAPQAEMVTSAKASDVELGKMLARIEFMKLLEEIDEERMVIGQSGRAEEAMGMAIVIRKLQAKYQVYKRDEKLLVELPINP